MRMKRRIAEAMLYDHGISRRMAPPEAPTPEMFSSYVDGRGGVSFAASWEGRRRWAGSCFQMWLEYNIEMPKDR
jgi:hypothetical protein